jgi:DNA repair photolyase
LGIHITITTTDEKLVRLIEPRAPRAELRLEALRRLRAAGICVAVFPNPVMPGITDSEASLDAVAKAAKEAGAMSFGGGPLFLPAASQQVFLPFVEREFPNLASRYREAFEKNVYLSKRYKDALSEKIRRIRERYQFTSGSMEYRPELWVEEEQMALFPLT